MKVKPFRGIRPPQELVEQVSSRPYDVLNSDEARREAEGNAMSLYHIIKPEINFPEGTDEHDERVYDAARQQFEHFLRKGWLKQDSEDCYYVYAQTMGTRTQYGLVVAAWVEDYMAGRIKKHELTRRDKEEDRMKHVRINRANMEPVFFAYPHQADLDALVAKVTAGKPEYDFVSQPDGFEHRFWVIKDPETIHSVTAIMAKIPAMYIADGHHRSAAAALVGDEMKRQNPHHTGKEEYNYFLAVCFPDNQLYVMDYNRVVRDLNGMTTGQFLKALEEDFEVEEKGTEPYRPEKLHEFSLYAGGKWYKLTTRAGRYDDSDPIGVLDVSVSSRLILDKLLGIKDLRTDKRIDFVGGLRGLDALKQRVDSGEMKAALALYPVTMQQIIRIADTGHIMPPKATWFEPKLRSGLVIHALE